MLKVGPSRPHPLPDDNAIAERPQQIVDWVSKNFGRKLEQLWKAVLPEGCDEETKHAYYHDLHWLLNQGFILLFSNNSLYLGKTDAKAGKERAVSQKEEKEAENSAKVEQPEKAEKEKPEKADSETPKVTPAETPKEAPKETVKKEKPKEEAPEKKAPASAEEPEKE